jgi:acetyltransferase-like isoleucine patch superfamily enzyme
MALRKIIKELYPGGRFFFKVSEDSKVSGCRPGGKNFAGNITVLGNSVLTLGKNVSFNSELYIGNNSEVTIEDDCVFNHNIINIANHSKVYFGKGVMMLSGPLGAVPIQVDNGTLSFEGYNRFMSEILVRFGGVMKVGKYTGIGYNSEIRCEESVTIGDYGLFSYDICIYDTDTHSTDWQERRKRITEGYPVGTAEKEKPRTKPVIIGDDVWMGKGATITKGTKIGNRCIVGTRTIVGGGEYPDDTTLVSDKPRIITRKNG